MILKAMGRSILLGAAWLLASKGFLLVMHSSDVLGKVMFLTKLLATAWPHAGVRLLLVMHSPDVFFKSHPLLEHLVTILLLTMKGLQITDSNTVQHSVFVPKHLTTTWLLTCN